MLVDFSELEGFQMPSRARAVAQWRERKEEADFEKLCAELKAANSERKRKMVTEAAAYRARVRARREAPRCQETTVCGERHQCRSPAEPGSDRCWLHRQGVVSAPPFERVA